MLHPAERKVLAAWQRTGAQWSQDVPVTSFDGIKGSPLEKWLVERMQLSNYASPDDKELQVRIIPKPLKKA